MSNVEDSTTAVQIVNECKTSEDEQQIYMIDASDLNMNDVDAAVAELDELHRRVLSVRDYGSERSR